MILQPELVLLSFDVPNLAKNHDALLSKSIWAIFGAYSFFFLLFLLHILKGTEIAARFEMLNSEIFQVELNICSKTTTK